MAVFRVERNTGYTVMSNHHLRNKELTLKAKGLLSQMLSLPEDWDYTLAGLSHINREKIDAIREAVKELEKAGYIVRSRERDEKGRLRGADYVFLLTKSKKYYYDWQAVAEPIAPTTAVRLKSGVGKGNKYAATVPGQNQPQKINRPRRKGAYTDESLIVPCQRKPAR